MCSNDFDHSNYSINFYNISVCHTPFVGGVIIACADAIIDNGNTTAHNTNNNEAGENYKFNLLFWFLLDCKDGLRNDRVMVVTSQVCSEIKLLWGLNALA